MEEERESRGEKMNSKLSVQKRIIMVSVLMMAMVVWLESEERERRECFKKGRVREVEQLKNWCWLVVNWDQLCLIRIFYCFVMFHLMNLNYRCWLCGYSL